MDAISQRKLVAAVAVGIVAKQVIIKEIIYRNKDLSICIRLYYKDTILYKIK